MNQRLDDGVVGRVEMVGQVERTVAGAVECLVAGRRHYPVVPADLAEVYVHRTPPAEVAPPSTPMFSTFARPAAALRVPPTTRVAVGPAPGRPRRRRRQSWRQISDEVSRRAGAIVSVRHEISAPTSEHGHGGGRPAVDVGPDDDEAEILLRSSTPSGHRSADDDGDPVVVRGASVYGQPDRALADASQVPCQYRRVVDLADAVRQRPGGSVDGHQRRGGPVVVAVAVRLEVQIELCAPRRLRPRNLGQVEVGARYLLRQKISAPLLGHRRLPTSVI